eukprot:TRINITY_DN2453_c0_g2_i1.p1 TRINITY_DN2453_c0_g2~~TRINITY_DN2453_c0_g2_i1.p1  ORF type:complete len:288 (+),score=21.56 TRINITY_DN2453_c0_g2_i1:140-1003(+)
MWVGAPVAQSLLIGCLVATALSRTSLRTIGNLANVFACNDLTQATMLSASLYNSVALERLWGSHQYLVYCLNSTAISAGLKWLIPTKSILRGGSRTALTTALLLRYITDVPSQFKLYVTLMALISLYDPSVGLETNVARGAVDVAIGFLAGSFASSDKLPLKKWRFPGLVCDWFDANVLPFTGTAQPDGSTVQMEDAIRDDEAYQEQLLPTGGWRGGMPGGRQPVDRGGLRRRPVGGGDAAGGVPPAPPESSVEQLMALGFGREDVVRALQRHGNDVETAAQSLFEG